MKNIIHVVGACAIEDCDCWKHQGKEATQELCPPFHNGCTCTTRPVGSIKLCPVCCRFVRFVNGEFEEHVSSFLTGKVCISR